MNRVEAFRPWFSILVPARGLRDTLSVEWVLSWVEKLQKEKSTYFGAITTTTTTKSALSACVHVYKFLLGVTHGGPCVQLNRW